MVNLTIWISLVFYASAVAVSFLVLDDRKRQKTYRILWRLGCIFALSHVLFAFHFVHHWDHQAAVKHTLIETERVTGIRFEYGIYFNYLFLLVWTMDCLHSHHGRLELARQKSLRCIWGWFVHLYMLLIILSATIVFEEGLIRYISLVVLSLLTLIYFRSRSIKVHAFRKG